MSSGNSKGKAFAYIFILKATHFRFLNQGFLRDHDDQTIQTIEGWGTRPDHYGFREGLNS